MENEISDKKKFDYSWVIIGLCFLMVSVTLGLCSSGRTLYLTAITDALGLPRGAFSLNNTFRYVTVTVLNLFYGPLVKRFGTKKLIVAGFLCLIAFALINSVATTLIGFYIAGILLGVGLFVSASAAGFAIGSPLGNVCYDIFGDYKLAFAIFGVLMFAVAILLQFVRAAAHKDRVAILEAAEAEAAVSESTDEAISEGSFEA